MSRVRDFAQKDSRVLDTAVTTRFYEESRHGLRQIIEAKRHTSPKRHIKTSRHIIIKCVHGIISHALCYIIDLAQHAYDHTACAWDQTK